MFRINRMFTILLLTAAAAQRLPAGSGTRAQRGNATK